MEKKELLGILGDFKRGDLTLNEANERILVLFNVVGQSEQLVCVCGHLKEKHSITTLLCPDRMGHFEAN